MKHSLSSEANIQPADQEIPRLICNPKVHYRVQKSAPHVFALSQMHPVHNFPPCFPKTYFNIIFTSTSVSSNWSSKISNAFLVSPMSASPPVHLIILHVIILITFCEAYKLRSSSFCSLLHPPATSSLLSKYSP